MLDGVGGESDEDARVTGVHGRDAALEALGVGKLLIQSAREREFANIYRADDEARGLSDEEFAAVLTFTRAAFEMAMAFRGRSSKRRD